jgi:flagellar hook-length control protein FliK
MDVSALDSLLRTDASPANPSRRFGDGSGERFARLLDRAEERGARPIARRPERDDDLRARPERPERAEKDDRPDRPAKTERAEKPERPERPERPQQRATKTEKPEETKPAADAPAPKEKPLAESKPIDDAEAAPEETIAAEPAIDAPVEQAVSPELVKMSALALAHQVGILLAQAHADAAPADAEAQTAEIADATKASRAVPVMPLPAQAAAAQAAEAKTESFADFALRAAANPAALAAAPGGEETDAKLDAKSDAKADPKGQLLVSIAQPMAVATPVAPVAAIAVQASAQAAAAKPDIAIAADGASAAAASLDDKSKQSAKPVENAPLFAQSLERAQNAQTTAPAADAKARPIVVPPHEQVALHVKKAVAEGKDMIVIRLNPVELGRIEVKLEIGADGTMRAAFAAERAQTLDALKNDSRQLERALQEAGLKPDAGGLNFSMRGDNRENAQAFADLGREFRGKQGNGDAEPGNVVGRDTPAPQAAYRGARRASGGLDLAV